MTNATLERAGRSERVDHRSYERQGIDKEPGEHFGPSAPHMVERGEDHERLAAAGDSPRLRGPPPAIDPRSRLSLAGEHVSHSLLRLIEDREKLPQALAHIPHKVADGTGQ